MWLVGKSAASIHLTSSVTYHQENTVPAHKFRGHYHAHPFQQMMDNDGIEFKHTSNLLSNLPIDSGHILWGRSCT